MQIHKLSTKKRKNYNIVSWIEGCRNIFSNNSIYKGNSENIIPDFFNELHSLSNWNNNFPNFKKVKNKYTENNCKDASKSFKYYMSHIRNCHDNRNYSFSKELIYSDVEYVDNMESLYNYNNVP